MRMDVVSFDGVSRLFANEGSSAKPNCSIYARTHKYFYAVLQKTDMVHNIDSNMEAMMEENEIERLLDELIEREGGYVDHPADRGGPTRYGITEAVAQAHGFRGSMRHLPRDEAAAIYRRLYWLRPRFDAVAERSPRLAAELFDTGVNMGPAVAATFLQRALTALNRTGKDYGNYILYLARNRRHGGSTGRRTTFLASYAQPCALGGC